MIPTTTTIVLGGTPVPVELTADALDAARRSLARFDDPAVRAWYARRTAELGITGPGVAESELVHGPQKTYAMALRAFAIHVAHQQMLAEDMREPAL
jgi:hypothetical protein